ncbi:MAG: type II toxin-antitoxin system VapC family toxin [Clostridia bacterium]|jgi:tRNA(fMet)-specific endonuclease VapC|nr:type II toxin-antitoxin system VapC family toxin [Clostridia bacterium]
MKYLLDTDICIYIIKQNPSRIIKKFHSLNVGDICISSIAYAELQYGINKSQNPMRNKIALAGFIAPIDILPFSEKAAVTFGKIRSALERQGQIIEPYDLLIAAQAISENLILVTNNTREYSRIPELNIENWAE